MENLIKICMDCKISKKKTTYRFHHSVMWSLNINVTRIWILPFLKFRLSRIFLFWFFMSEIVCHFLRLKNLQILKVTFIKLYSYIEQNKISIGHIAHQSNNALSNVSNNFKVLFYLYYMSSKWCIINLADIAFEFFVNFDSMQSSFPLFFNVIVIFNFKTLCVPTFFKLHAIMQSLTNYFFNSSPFLNRFSCLPYFVQHYRRGTLYFKFSSPLNQFLAYTSEHQSTCL